MRNIAGEIEGITGGKLVRHAINDESHLTFENVNDLLLRVSVLGHATPGRQRSDHLIHVLTIRDGPAGDSGTNFNCWGFSFHLQDLTREAWSRERSVPLVSHLSLACPDLSLAESMKISIPVTTMLFAILIAAPSFAQSPADKQAAASGAGDDARHHSDHQP